MEYFLKIAAVDDIRTDREFISKKIKNYMHSRELKYQLFLYDSGEQFVAALENERFDVVFMDIYMEGITGMEAAARLREKDSVCKLVFLTISEESARQCCAFCICHYLVKCPTGDPVNHQDFLQAMENCCIQRQVDVPYLNINVKGFSVQLDTKHIMYINIDDRNTVIHLKNQALTAGRGFSAIIKPLLADRRFLLCIKGILVNMDYICEPEGNGFRLKGGEYLPISLRGKKRVIQAYRSYLFDQMGELI